MPTRINILVSFWRSSKKYVGGDRLRIGKVLRIEGEKGAALEIDIEKLGLSDEQGKILDRLVEGGSFGAKAVAGLGRRERDLLRELKARIGSEHDDLALIVRFDAKWVRIDE